MMSEVATVSCQRSVKAGAAAVKAGGASAAAGAASALDGAFAAMLGKAGDGDASGDPSPFASMLTLDGKGAAAAQAALDPVQVQNGLSLADDADGAVGVCVVDIGGLDSEGGTLVKPVRAKSRNTPDEVSLIAIAANMPIAPVPTDAPAAKAGAARKSTSEAGVEGVGAVDPLAGGKLPVDTAAQAQAEVPVKLATAAPLQPQAEGSLAKGGQAKSGQTQNVTTNAQAGVAISGGETADASAQNGEGQSEGGKDRAPAQTVAVALQPDDSALPSADSALRSIVQSLPPVLQSQLSVGAANGAAPAASTGQLLGDQVIDMSVSGQWIDRMAREIASLAEGTGHSRFQLSPPNLGKIQVDLWQSDSKMNLRLIAETDEAARRLSEGRSALEAHARVASLSLGQVSVEKASSSDSARDQGQHQQHQRQGAESSNGQGQQQASAQAQGQSAQGRGQSGANRGGNSAVIGQDQAGEAGQAARTARANDPRVRFA